MPSVQPNASTTVVAVRHVARHALLIGGLTLSAIASQVMPTNAQGTVQIGVLNCTVAGGAGFVFGSSKSLDCTFQSGSQSERYAGTISKFGIDVGATAKGVIAWAVFAPTQTVAPGALSGTYGGVTGEATVGVGLGANALVGGSNRTIGLQPLSVQAQSGLNVAVGVAALELRPR